MSLAPSDRRALARIENSLSSSDPKLAAMLATFAVPVTVRATVCLARLLGRCLRIGCLTWVMVALPWCAPPS